LIGVIVAAAGSGRRFGTQTPKQFLDLHDLPVYLHSVQQFDALADQVVVVAPEDWLERVQSQISTQNFQGKICVVAGKQTRQESVYQGLQSLGQDVELVLIHDAARPHVSTALIDRIIEGTRQHGACIPGLEISDTVKEVSPDSDVRVTLDRLSLRAVQTPQGFRMDLLKRAFEKAIQEGFIGTDEAGLVENLGQKVRVVAGDPDNLKITWPSDL